VLVGEAGGFAAADDIAGTPADGDGRNAGTGAAAAEREDG
jgi:hypothetical protein